MPAPVLVGVLIPLDRSRPPPPLDALPMGRAARALLDEGVHVMLGDEVERGGLTGTIATRAGWRPASAVHVCGVYDRFPRLRHPARHAALLAALGDVPLGNPPTLRVLSQDKLASQRHLESRGVLMPEACSADTHGPRLQWEVAFAKPRHGALGEGVSRLTRGALIPQMSSAGRGPESMVLQRAVPPLPGWAGVATRTLVQRDRTGQWVANPPVARCHRHDPVVNAVRGAQVLAAADLLRPRSVAATVSLALAAARALATHPDGALLLELGVDAMIDANGEPWVIEVNTRPWGRLAALAAQHPDRFLTAHVAAAARPLRFLAHHASRAAGA